MKNKVFLLTILFIFSIGGLLEAQTVPSNQTNNSRKGSVFARGSKPKDWGKKKTYMNPIKSKFFQEIITYDIGLNLGLSNSLTDIYGNGEEKQPFLLDMQLAESKYVAGLFARYKYSRVMAIYGHVNYVKLTGADSLSKVEAKKNRNNSFENNLIELSIRSEFYKPKPIRLFQPKKTTYSDIYAFTGLTLFYNKPKVTGPASDYNTYNGFSNPDYYQKIQLGIPLGLGYSFTVKNKWRFGLDASWTLTFTDYIDGFTTTYSEANDSYVVIQAKISKVFINNKNKRSWN